MSHVKYDIVNGIKKCSTCLVDKSIDKYYETQPNSGKLRPMCIDCFLEKSRKQKIEYRKRQDVKKHVSEYNKKYRVDNLSVINARREKNKPLTNKVRNARRNKQYKSDLRFNLEHKCRTRLQSILKHKGTDKYLDYLGCTSRFFINYIESLFVDGMSWANRSEWNLDHIQPCCIFDLTDDIQLKQCFHYSNIRPLWKRDNIEKAKKDVLLKKQINNTLL